MLAPTCSSVLTLNCTVVANAKWNGQNSFKFKEAHVNYNFFSWGCFVTELSIHYFFSNLNYIRNFIC